MYLRLQLFIILSFLLGGCKKQVINHEIKPSIISGYEHLEQIWTKKLAPGEDVTYIGMYKNLVFYSRGDVNFNQTLVAYNKLTGDSVWSWNDPGFLAGGFEISDNIMICSVNGSSKFVAIDLNTAKTIWTFTLPQDSYYAGMKLLGKNFFYACNQGNPYKGNDSTIIYKVNSMTGAEYPIYKIYTADRNGYQPNIRFSDLWVSSSGDTILPLNIRGYNILTKEENSSISALNITKKNFYFDYKDTVKGETFFGRPILSGNKVYYKGWDYHCSVDLISKSLDYLKGIDNAVKTNSKFQLIDDVLFSLSGNTSMLSAYSLDGNLNWGLKIGAYSSEISKYKEKFYCSCENDKIYCLNVDGSIFWSVKPQPDSYKHFYNNLLIDPSTGYLYTWGDEFIYCFKIKE